MTDPITGFIGVLSGIVGGLGIASSCNAFMELNKKKRSYIAKGRTETEFNEKYAYEIQQTRSKVWWGVGYVGFLIAFWGLIRYVPYLRDIDQMNLTEGAMSLPDQLLGVPMQSIILAIITLVSVERAVTWWVGRETSRLMQAKQAVSSQEFTDIQSLMPEGEDWQSADPVRLLAEVRKADPAWAISHDIDTEAQFLYLCRVFLLGLAGLATCYLVFRLLFV